MNQAEYRNQRVREVLLAAMLIGLGFYVGRLMA